jgi:hypothetical protein
VNYTKTLKATGDGEEFPKAEILRPFQVRVLRKKKMPGKMAKTVKSAPAICESFNYSFFRLINQKPFQIRKGFFIFR